MELKFRVTDFSKIKKFMKSAKLVDKRIEHYVYLKDGSKLQKTEEKFYLVSIKKRANMFALNHREITQNQYNKIKRNSEIKRILSNKRQIYKLGRMKISFNQLEVGKFVILDGTRKDSSVLARKLGLKRLVTKPFSDL